VVGGWRRQRRGEMEEDRRQGEEEIENRVQRKEYAEEILRGSSTCPVNLSALQLARQ
jgi:hypothetical protein